MEECLVYFLRICEPCDYCFSFSALFGGSCKRRSCVQFPSALCNQSYKYRSTGNNHTGGSDQVREYLASDQPRRVSIMCVACTCHPILCSLNGMYIVSTPNNMYAIVYPPNSYIAPLQRLQFPTH